MVIPREGERDTDTGMQGTGRVRQGIRERFLTRWLQGGQEHQHPGSRNMLLVVSAGTGYGHRLFSGRGPGRIYGG